MSALLVLLKVCLRFVVCLAVTVLEKIESADDAMKMGPKGERLSTIQVSTLRRWIEEGAVWNETEANHWAVVDKRAAH